MIDGIGTHSMRAESDGEVPTGLDPGFDSSGCERVLRVAIVAPPWFHIPPRGYGGIERVCFDLVEGLVEHGHEVTLVAAGSSAARCRVMQAFPEPLSGLGTAEGGLQETRYGAHVARIRDELNVDLVHDHSLVGPLAGIQSPVPTLVTAHGPPSGIQGNYYRELGLPLVAISHSQRAMAPRLPWVGTVHNGVDVTEYPFRTAKENFVLYMSRLTPDKGAHLAIDACLSAGLPLVLAGKCSTPHERKYFANSVAPRLGPHARWIGEASREQSKRLLSRARCLLVPIQWEEPFGLVVIEALACGTPVVGLCHGSLPELVEHGRTGFICRDPSELPDRIVRAGEIDPRACRQDALERFHATKMVYGYESVYRRLLESVTRSNVTSVLGTPAGVVESDRPQNIEQAAYLDD